MVEKANKISGHISNRIGGPLGGDVRKVAGETDITVVKEDQIMPIQNQLVEQGLAPLNHLGAQAADQYEGFARALSLRTKSQLQAVELSDAFVDWMVQNFTSGTAWAAFGTSK
jgi:hypothetical protein